MILRNITAVVVMSVGLILSSTPVMAGDYAGDVGAKFSRGLANTTTGWGEIPKNIVNESRDKNAFVGVTYGTLKGTAHSVGRTAVGVFDLATFFIPTNGYVHSTYVWEDTSRETTYGAQ